MDKALFQSLTAVGTLDVYKQVCAKVSTYQILVDKASNLLEDAKFFNQDNTAQLSLDLGMKNTILTDAIKQRDNIVDEALMASRQK